MGLKALLMDMGITEEEADRMVAEGLPQMQANVAYNESRMDLIRMEGADDFRD